MTRSRVREAAEIGFLASRGEVRRFGDQAIHIKVVRAKTTDSRSFTEVVKEEKMDNRGGTCEGYKRGRGDGGF